MNPADRRISKRTPPAPGNKSIENGSDPALASFARHVTIDRAFLLLAGIWYRARQAMWENNPNAHTAR